MSVFRREVTISNRDCSFRFASMVEVHPGNGMVIVGGGMTPIARIHGAFATRGIGPLHLATEVGRHLMYGAGLVSDQMTDLAVGSSVPSDHSTFLGTSTRNILGLTGVTRPVVVNTLCTSGAAAMSHVMEQLSLRGAGVAMAIGVDDQSLGRISLDNRFRKILGRVTGRELPMEFGLVAEALDTNHPFARFGIAPGQFATAVEEFVTQHGPLPFNVGDGITLSFRDSSTGEFMWDTAATVAREFGVTDAEAVKIAIESHARYFRALDRGFFAGLMAAVPGVDLAVDENPVRGANARLVGRGRTAPGVHSGTSSQMGGSAAGVLIASAAEAQRLGLPVFAEVVATSFSAVPPEVMGLGPISATLGLLEAHGLRMDKIGHIEVNEAFAAVVGAFCRTREFGFGYEGAGSVYPERVNPYGGAIAKGHVMGAKFVEMAILATRFFELHPDSEYSIVTLCGGGGQGAAMLLRNPSFLTEGARRIVNLRGEVVTARADTADPEEQLLFNLRSAGYLTTAETVSAVERAIAEAAAKGRPLPELVHLWDVINRAPGGTLPMAALLTRATELATLRLNSTPGTSPTIGKRIGIVCVGLKEESMGHQIAYDFARAGYEVHMADQNIQIARDGLARIERLVFQAVERGMYTAEEGGSILGRIYVSDSMTGTVAELQGVGKKFEMILEAATENPAIKQKIFDDLRAVTDGSTILATNSSSITAGACGADAVYHYANPPHARFVIDGSIADAVTGERRDEINNRLAAIAQNTNKAIYLSGKDVAGSIYNPIWVAAYTAVTGMMPDAAAGIRAAAEAKLTECTDAETKARLEKIRDNPQDYAVALLEHFYTQEMGLNIRRDGMGVFRMVGRIGAPDVYVHTADNIAAAYGETFRANDVLRAQLADWTAGTKRLWFEMDDHREYAECVASRMKELDDADLKSQSAVVESVLRQWLWSSILTMAGLMRDKGVVTEPDVLDNAVGIALMWRTTPELYRRLIDSTLPRIPSVKVSVNAETGVATVTMNRPRYANAVDRDAVVDLHRIAVGISEDPAVKMVVLQGEGKNFVAGADISWFAARQAEGVTGLAKIYDKFVLLEREAMELFKSDGRLLVVVANGANVGGGVEMVAQADYVVIPEGLEGERTTFNMPEASLGISTGYGSHVDLVAKVGVAHARRILLTGAKFGSAEAVALGFANVVVPRHQLQESLAKLANIWKPVAGIVAKDDFLKTMAGDRPASNPRLAALEKLWSDEESVRWMVLGQVPPQLEGDEKKLAEAEVAAIRRGSPEAIAMLNRMVDEGEGFDLRAGLIQIFDTRNARAAIGAFAGGPRFKGFVWPS